MADFTGNQIRHTYQRLLQIDDRFGSRYTIQDGTGSLDLDYFNLSGSINLTGSQTITGNLTVTDSIRAKQFIVSTISSSILTQTGSTSFGDTLNDTHTFTGSIYVTGSMDLDISELNLNGTFRHTGSLIHSGTLSVVSSGNIELTGDITQSGNVLQTGDTLQTGNTTITGSIAQVGDTVRNGNTELTGSLLHTGSGYTAGQYEVTKGVFGAFFANPQTINVTTRIPANYNSRIYGPITVAAGKTLTVGSNAKLEIIDI